MTNEIRKDEPVEIYPAANGFMVRRPISYARADGGGLSQEFIVFESFAGLSAWLSVHFTHRQSNVFKDMNEGIVGG